METYFAFWTVVMFAFTVLVTIIGFGLIYRSQNRAFAQSDEAWQRLYAKADNTERLTQQILMRLASEQAPH